MSEMPPPHQRLQETIERIREASRERFLRRPGSDEHRRAIDAEISLDRELDVAIRDEPTHATNGS